METKIRTYRLKKVLDIISDTLNKVKAETGYRPVKLDSATIKKKIEDYESKICNSGDVETAKDRVGELRKYIYGPDCVCRIRLMKNEIREHFTGLAKKLKSDALRYVKKRKREAEASIERKVHSLVKEKRAAAEQRLKDRIKKIAKKMDDARVKAMQKVMKIRKKMEKYREQEKKKAEAGIRAEIDEYIKNERIKIENKIGKDVGKYVNERKTKLLRAKSLFEEMAKKLEK